MYKLFADFTSFLWGMPLLIVIVVTGVYFTVRSGFFQFRHFGHIISSLFNKERRAGDNADEKKLTPF